jgi:hypothetical protein
MNNNNKNNIFLNDNISFNPNIKQCVYYLKKNGKMIHYNMNNYNKYLCVLNDYLNLNINYYPLLEDKNEYYIVKKLLILKYLQNNDLKYIVLIKDRKSDFINNSIINSYIDSDLICSFKISNINKLIKYLYYFDIVLKDYKKYKIIVPYNKKKHFYSVNIINYLSFLYITNKLIFKKILKKTNCIKIFYDFYIFYLETELKKKYNTSIFYFPNYHNLYLFLKKEGYVKKFYEKLVPKIIKTSVILEKKVLKNSKGKDYDDFKNDIISRIKKFKDVDLFDLIQNNLNKKFDKVFIKNKFIELCKKYNI